MDKSDPYCVRCQNIFASGIMIFLLGGAIWFFVGCDRYIKPYCVAGYADPFYWIGAGITTSGLLMFGIGWLLMNEARKEPQP